MSIKVKDIKISYDQNTIIDQVSFQVEQGELYTLLGKSGMGKSSILRAISGLIPLAQGEIIIDDLNITDLPVDQRNIAMIFQKPLLFPHLNVFENIAFGLKMHHWNKSDIQKRVTELLKIFQISELATHMPIEISGGQQQRVAIARALTLKQKILFMDEPFSSLDPYLKEHGFQGKTKTGSSIDRFIFSESFEVLFSERKGKETITVISSHGEELTVIQQDNMNFIKGETVYLQVLNPYMNIISMDDFNISSISTHTYHPIPQG